MLSKLWCIYKDCKKYQECEFSYLKKKDDGTPAMVRVNKPKCHKENEDA